MAYNTNADRLLDKTATNLDQSLGKYGITYHIDPDDGAETTANGIAIQCLRECTFSKLVVSGVDLRTGLSGNLTLAAGTIIYGNVTNVVTNTENFTSLAIIYNK